MTSLRDGRVFFGGDAAHVHSPAGGQGMNAGIQDMINLSWKLAMVLRGAARPQLLDTYETDRLPVIGQLVAMTERATKVFNSTSPVAHALLTPAGAEAAVAVADPGQGRASARPACLRSYRGRPLSAGGGRIGALRAGDRVPDVRLPEGRLYDLLDMSTLTLFVMARHRAAIARRTATGMHVITVRHIGIAPELAPGPAWLLVRPDGYLAAAGGLDGGARLSRLVGPLARREPQSPNVVEGGSGLGLGFAEFQFHERTFGGRGHPQPSRLTRVGPAERFEVGRHDVDARCVAAHHLVGDRSVAARLQQQRLDAAVAQASVEIGASPTARQPLPARRHRCRSPPRSRRSSASWNRRCKATR